VEDGLQDLVDQGQAGVPTLPGEGEQPPDGEPPPESPQPTTPPATEQPPPATEAPPPDLAAAQARMDEAEQELTAAYESGEFPRIADALEEWVEARAALDAAEAASGGG
jgi:hypothetical protein